LGRPAQAYDDKGELVWQVEFDIYGRIREDTFNNKPFIPFRQLGQYEDVETGLYYNRFRYYNPETGLYISQDPIKLEGNNPNFYAYVHDSNAWVDPFGLSECGISGKRIKHKLDPDLENTFLGRKYASYILEEDVILYRAGKKDVPLGQFFSKDAPTISELQVRIDKAILPIWPDGSKSIIDTGYKIQIPKGTVLHIGEIAPQGGIYVGGTEQILIQTPWKLDGVKILDQFPLFK
jgi:RHS repeat-associated protein